MLKKVLIVESSDEWSDIYNRELREFSIAIAPTLAFAEQYWNEQGPFDCVVVCGMLSPEEQDTTPFVKMLRDANYQGPIIAASNMPQTRVELLEAGCSHAVEKSKWDTAPLVKQVLNS